MKILTIFKYYWPHIKQYKNATLAMFVLYGVGAALMNFAIPILYKEIIDIVSQGLEPSLVAGQLMQTVFLLAVAVVSYNILYRLGDWAIVFVQSNILKDLSNSAYAKLHEHSYEFFTNRFAGALVTKLKRFVRSFETIHDQIVFALWFDSIKLVSALVAFWLFVPMLLLPFAVWFVGFVVVSYFMIRVQYGRDLKRASAESNTTAVLADTITNVLNIKMFAAWSAEKSTFNKVVSKEKKSRDSSWYYHNFQHAFYGFYIAFFEIGIMYYVLTLWINGDVTSGVIVLVQMYVFKSFEIVWNISRNIRRVMEAFADAEEMVEIFEQQREVIDMPSPLRSSIADGDIEIKNITFAYEKNKPVFKDFSLSIAPGERVGLVGHSGSGKTTITKLLLRFADLQGGQILIDGQDISQIKQNDLRRSISYVPQEPMLFHRTLTENIKYANQHATQNEIEIAAKKAHADDFIKSLDKGYKTLVGERGVKLSGGERQRVAIARAMLKDSPILILDEATSALDSISERHIQEAFQELMKGRTTLVIAHRLSTIKKMDRIIVFDKGVVVEEGTHKNLIEKKGVYHTFWQEQSSGVLGE